MGLGSYIPGIRQFWHDFIKRGGHFVTGSSMLSKVLALASSFVVIRILSVEEFGLITYARTVMMLISPMIGLGLNHSLLRYGPDVDQRIARKDLYLETLRIANWRSLLLTVILVGLSWIICYNQPESTIFLVILSVSLIGDSAFSILQSYFRIIHSNKLYAKVTNLQSAILVGLTIALTYFFGGIGYCLAYAIAGMVSFAYVYKSRTLRLFKKVASRTWTPEYQKSFLKYGLLVGFGSIASQLAITTDTLLIGNLISDSSELALYRVASLIIFNLLFIPKIIMTTDFVLLSQNKDDGEFLSAYMGSYLKSIGLVSVLAILVSMIISEFLFGFLFGEAYAASATCYNILAIGLIGALTLRVPLGNLLNAVGRAQWNIYASIGLVVVNIPLTYYAIIYYGINGAAISTSVVWWISGITCIFLYKAHINSVSVGKLS